MNRLRHRRFSKESGRGTSRRRTSNRSTLRSERLEERAMLTVGTDSSAVVYPFHNSTSAYDVNSDGNTSNTDLYILLTELRRTGPRNLITGQLLNSGGEGEAPLMVDVNGDNLLSNLDLFYMVREVRGEGQIDMAQFNLSFLNNSNAPLPNNTVDLNAQFQLLVTIDDLRTSTPSNIFGIAAAYLDIHYTSQVQAVSNLNFAPLAASDPAYSQNAADQNGAIINASNLLDEVGNSTIAPLGVGPNPVTLVRATFSAVSAPPLVSTAAVGDSFVVPQGMTTAVNVLSNDDLVGTVPFTSSQATGVGHELVTTDPAAVVPVDDIIYGGATLRVRTGVTLQTGQPAHGQTVVVGQNIQYTPTPGYSGSDSFSYTITGAGGGQSTATVAITVSAFNNPPTANDNFISIETNSVGNSLQVLANDSTLPDTGEVLTITSFTPPNQNGMLSFGPGNASLVYTPAMGFVGTEVFDYTISDGHGGSDTATVSLLVAPRSNLIDVSVEVHDLSGQEVPVVGINEEFFFVVYVDDLRAGNPPDVSLLGVASAYLDLFYNSSFMQFVAAANSFGVDITWGPGYDADPVNLGNPNSGFAEMVTPVVPGIFDEIGTALEGFSSGGTGNPLDPPGGLKSELFRIRMLATGLVDNTPVDINAPEDPLNEITLAEPPLLVDLADVVFNSTTFSIRALSPTAPVALDDFGSVNPFSYTTLEDTTLVVSAAGTLDGFSGAQGPAATFGVLNNDTDADAIGGTSLEAILVSTTTHGQLTLNANGTFSYVPNMNYHGPDSFSYRVSDGGRLSASTATATINVTSVLDRPIALGDVFGINTNNPLSPAAPGILVNDSNVEPGTLVPMLVTGPSHGTLLGGSLNADGTFTYNPVTDYIGPDSFTYKIVNTSTMLESDVVTVNIAVGALPGSFDGRVWADVNGNHLLDRTLGGLEIEHGIGGVVLRLTGRDAFNMPVNLSTTTNASGGYTFGNVFPGNYTLTEEHPAFMMDVTPNQFSFVLHSGEHFANVHFPELGLTSDFIGQRDFLCSTGHDGIWAGINTAGTQEWFVLDSGWANIRSVSASLSADRIFATLQVVNSSNQTFTATMATVGNEHFRFLGDDATGYVVRFDGNFADFGLTLVPGGGGGGEGEGESYARAVDTIFEMFHP